MKISGWRLISIVLLFLGLYFDMWNLGVACVFAVMIHAEKRFTEVKKRVKELEEIVNAGDKP